MKTMGSRNNSQDSGRNNESSVVVKAPYNFVPLNKQVFFPSWSELVFQDVPLKGGLSGKIDLEIEARTDVFIRGREYKPSKEWLAKQAKIVPKKEGDNSHVVSEKHKWFEFFQHDEKYCIPGSSVKGVIRSTMESISMSKLNLINDDTFGYRDLNNRSYVEKYKKLRIIGGFISLSHNGQYKLRYSNSDIMLVSHYVIDKLFIKKGKKLNEIYLNKFDKRAKHSEYKYKLLNFHSPVVPVGINGTFKLRARGHQIFVRELTRSTRDAGPTHYLVMTGQPGPRKNEKGLKGKLYEFVFPAPNVEITLSEDNSILRDFFTAYRDNDRNNWSKEYEFFKNHVKDKQGFPVFIATRKASVQEALDIEHIGISYMHQLKYKYSVGDMLPDVHFSSRLDLTECVFGRVEKPKPKPKVGGKDSNFLTMGISLWEGSSRGRVSFRNFYSDLQVKVSNESDFHVRVLSSPRATFYPFYLDSNDGNPITYNQNGVIAGRKRYIVRKAISLGEDIPRTDFSTSFKPLPTGTKFKGQIVFHNLLPEELGALLASITFFGNEECLHSIGMGKPYGYGAVRMNVVKCELKGGKVLDDKDTTRLMDSFINLLNSKSTEKDIMNSIYIRELLAMAKPHDDERLTYMILKHFAKVKQQRKILPRFTEFIKKGE